MAQPQPSLRLIADNLGVSVSTVSRVLSGKAEDYRIGEDTCARIRREAERLNYQPNQVARGLRLQRTRTLGLIIPDVSNPFFAAIARTIEHAARAAGYSILLADSAEDTAIETDLLGVMRSRNVDGMIVAPVGESSGNLVALAETGLPLVLLDRYVEGFRGSAIASDNFAGGKMGTEHLLAHGHRDIACVQGLPGALVNRERVDGFSEAMKEAGVPAKPGRVVGTAFTQSSGYESAVALLESPDPPTAILSLGNLLTLGILRALRERGLKLGRDISLVSFDEQPYSELLEVPLTTIAQDTDRLGSEALRILLEKIEETNSGGGSKSRKQNAQRRRHIQRIALPVKLIPRASVSTLG